MEADGTLRALKERWGLSLVTEADVEAEQERRRHGPGGGGSGRRWGGRGHRGAR